MSAPASLSPSMTMSPGSNTIRKVNACAVHLFETNWLRDGNAGFVARGDPDWMIHRDHGRFLDPRGGSQIAGSQIAGSQIAGSQIK
jgi:hypothetical protein